MKHRIQRSLPEKILYAAWLSAKAGKLDLANQWLKMLELQTWN